MNRAMQIERSGHLNDEPYERKISRRGCVYRYPEIFWTKPTLIKVPVEARAL